MLSLVCAAILVLTQTAAAAPEPKLKDFILPDPNRPPNLVIYIGLFDTDRKLAKYSNAYAKGFAQELKRRFPGRKVVIIHASTFAEARRQLVRTLEASLQVEAVVVDSHGTNTNGSPTLVDSANRRLDVAFGDSDALLGPLKGHWAFGAHLAFAGCDLIKGATLAHVQRVMQATARAVGLDFGAIYMNRNPGRSTAAIIESRFGIPPLTEIFQFIDLYNPANNQGSIALINGASTTIRPGNFYGDWAPFLHEYDPMSPKLSNRFSRTMPVAAPRDATRITLGVGVGR